MDPINFDFGTLGRHGQGNAEAPKSGAELYVDQQRPRLGYSKQKEHRSPRYVQLYDTDLTKLDDETKINK